jgi:hypothetical protein
MHRQHKVFNGTGGQDHELERLMVNHGDGLPQEKFWRGSEVAIVIALGCELEMSDDPDNAGHHEGHCCYGAAMEEAVGGNVDDQIDSLSHQCRGGRKLSSWR